MHLTIAIFFFCIVVASPVGHQEKVGIIRPLAKLVQTRNDVNQHCPSAKWTDYVIFYFGNYFAHVATVQTYPGESLRSTIQALVLALLLPAAGISRGLTTIIRFAKLQKTPLQTAARAGALCMVVRTKEWQPLSGEPPIDGIIVRSSMKIVSKRNSRAPTFLIPALQKRFSQSYDATMPGEEMEEEGSPWKNIEISRQLRVYWPPWAQELSKSWHFYDACNEYIHLGQKVHGFCNLSTGYALAHVPRDAIVTPLGGFDSTKTLEVQYPAANAVSASYSFPKTFIAVVQLLYAAFTLGRASGGQITEYGYAAFGLTVTPYALMSLVNLVGGLVTPSYPALFLISSSVMEEAKIRGSIFDGVIGTLREIVTPDVEGTELVSGNFSSDSHLSNDPNHVPSSASTLRFTPRAKSPHLWPPNISMRVVRHDKSDPQAPCVFIPSCPCLDRQKKYPYSITRAAPAITSNGTAFLNPLKGENTASEVIHPIASIPPTLFISALSIAIIGAMSGFHARNSTFLQRFATMTWVCAGIYVGSSISWVLAIMPPITSKISPISLCYLFSLELSSRLGSRLVGHPLMTWQDERIQTVIKKIDKYVDVVSKLSTVAIICAPSVLGFVVVGLMIRDYGICST